MVRECVKRLTSVVLQVGSADHWVWQLHFSMCYFVSSACNKLTKMDINDHHIDYNFVCLKEVSFKVSIFA